MPNERDIIVSLNNRDVTIAHLAGESQVERSKHLSQKFIPQDELEMLGNFLRRRQLKVAYASGAYDVIHKGHARFLNLARSLGDVLVVGLNSDGSIKRYKGEDRPILNQDDRAEMLSFIEPVTFITIYEEPTGEHVIEKLKPDTYLCVEGSWEGDIATKKEIIAMANVGGQSFWTPRQAPTQSTSNIIEKIAQIYSPKIIEDYRKMMKQTNDK